MRLQIHAPFVMAFSMVFAYSACYPLRLASRPGSISVVVAFSWRARVLVDGSRTAPALFPSHVEISSRAHHVGQDQSTVAERVETTVDDRFPAEVRVSLFP